MMVFIPILHSFILICTILLAELPKYAFSQSSCLTPDDVLGNCLPIKECDTILTVFEDVVRPLSVGARTYLRKFDCGKGESILVCCPNKQLSNRELQFQPISVENHSNVNLLPKYEECGAVSSADRIINGQKAGVFEFPWMVLLNYRNKESGKEDFKCGGTIINERYILTAGHCVTDLDDDIELVNVRVGEFDTATEEDCELIGGQKYCAPPPQDLEFEKTIPHEKFNIYTFSFDIALIRLKTALNISTGSTLRAICLPIRDIYLTHDFSKNDTNAIVTGWGITESGYNSTYLRKVELPIILGEDCSGTYAKRASIGHRHICAGGRDGKDSCQGDSGGPMLVIRNVNNVATYIEMGLVSFGPRSCAIEKSPGVYTFVPYYMNWILDHIEP